MDYEMETLIQALVIQFNMVWNQFHGIIHELIGYALALDRTEDTACWCKIFHGEVCMFHCVLYQSQYQPDRSSSIGKL